MYRLLIVDDEPLVQIGLKSMLAGSFEEVETVGTAPNGAEALSMIRELKPDIVITDIKMPRMSGLELLKESQRLYGPIPVFIILTAYEEFDLARQALAGQAVDYLVKIELNKSNLKEALIRAKERIKEHKRVIKESSPAPTSLDEFRQKFMLRLFNRQISDPETLKKQAEDLQLGFDYDRYIVVYGQIISGSSSAIPDIITDEPKEQHNSTADEPKGQRNSTAGGSNQKPGLETEHKSLILYSSCLNMTKEIVERYIPCYTVSNDTRHFTLIFYFNSEQAVADIMGQIQEAIENARSMIMNYFNVTLRFGIGTAVKDPLDIATSWEEASTAAGQTDASSPVKLFSHIVGANRRSGKDKLIASIQEYINENLGGKLQLNEVAEVFGLSPAYLSVIFKKNTEVGFSEYVYTKKIEKAKQMLLSGDMKIYEVADALGFESAFYFSKVFKKVDGHSPREYIQSKQ